MGSSVGKILGGVRLRGAERSQSEVIGVVLVLGMVIAGAFAVVALGATAINDTEDRLSEDRAEKTLTQFASEASLVALGETSAQQSELPGNSGEEYTVDSNAGWMKIEVENATDPGVPDWTDNGEMINVTLGEVAFTNGESKVAYQGGGVFRATNSGGVMISPPEFHYREGTLTLPIVNITSDDTLYRNAQISGEGSTAVFPNVTQSALNPLDDKEITITVQSEYYEGWATYFEQRTESSVTTIDDEEKVIITLTTPFEQVPVDSAITMTSPGEFTLNGEGTAIEDKNTHSYDSRDGTFEETIGNEGDILAAGDVSMDSSKISINGSVYSSEGDIKCHNSQDDGAVAGYIQAPEGVTTNCEDVAAEESGPPNVDFEDATTDYSIESFVAEAKEESDNTEYIEDNQLDLDGGEGEITSGKYYLEDLKLSDGNELTLNTSGGDINIAVENYVDIDGDNIVINITGDGHVGFWINGSEKTDVNMPSAVNSPTDEGHFYLDGEIKITTDDEREDSTKFSVWGKSDFKAYLNGNSNSEEPVVHGLFYAPGDDSLVVSSGGTIYGAALAGTVELHQSSILFDKALSDEDNAPEGPDVISITFLHVTENKIAVED